MKSAKTAPKIKNEIDETIKALIEAGICDDSNFSSITTGPNSFTDITFSGAEHISLSFSDIEYGDLYNEFKTKRSFNIKLIDGGLLQMSYRLKKNELQRHRLAFYPSPILRPFQDDPDSYMRDDLFIDIISRRIVPFPMRFDFDCREGVFKDMEHPKSHLTLGDVENCRIPVSSPVSPARFADFIVRNFYQSKKHQFTETLPKQSIQFSECISKNESAIAHLKIPT